jgi:metallo-beta-lactamase family protein
VLAKLTFLGAARNVTGSCYLLESQDTRVLIDCGLYQERKYQERNWQPFPFAPQSIDAVFLTHAHLDHCGLLPKLIREGYKGKIYCTQATAEIAEIILLDAAHLQEEDAIFKAERHKREGHRGPFPEIPLYTVKDAEAVKPHFSAVEYLSCVGISSNVEGCYYEAGHVLGAAVISINIRQDGKNHRVIFSGDIGEPHRPIINDPTLFDEAEYIVIESTYGDRTHEEHESIDIQKQLRDCINRTVSAGGNIVVPSFALERSQEMLYHLNELFLRKEIPPLTVFLDSPMAIQITEVFKRHAELFDKEMMQRLRQGNSFFSFENLRIVQSEEESRAINNVKESSIIIAGSGMVTGGRVKHHIVNNIRRPESTILFVGYQAEGTPGRILLDGAREIRLLGQIYP